MKYSNLFYFRYINEIGGIESWYYYIAKMYGNYDITIAYMDGNIKQIKRLAKYVRMVKWHIGEQLECDNLFVNFNTQVIPYVKYNRLIFFAHGDYKDEIIRGHMSKSDVMSIVKELGDKCEYYGVSQLVANSWYEITKIPMKVCYNPILLDKKKKFIRICSAQRMTKEKGLNRIIQLVKTLDLYAETNDCLWEWDIYTNDTDRINNPNVHYRKTTLDVMSMVDRYDWFAILSDNEGFCYGAVESLLRGTPLITTPLPVFKELGINESNSITLKFDCFNVKDVVIQMFNDKKVFEYKEPISSIGNLLVKNKSTYIEETSKPVKVKATRKYELMGVVDTELGYMPSENEEWETDYFRAEMLVEKGYVKSENIYQNKGVE